MGVNFFLILIHKTFRVVTVSIILPGNGWLSCKLNKTYCNLVNFDSCFMVHSLGIGLFCLSMGRLESADGSVSQ